MSIVFRELRANLKTFLIWTASLTVVYFAASSEFSVFESDPAIIEAMQSLEFIFEVMGTSLANITTPEGYLSILGVYILLPIGIYASLLGSNIISKEERGKTAEFLFTLPLSRSKVLVSKLIVGFFYIVLMDATIIGSLIAIFSRYELTESFYSFVFYLAIGIFFIELIFMSIGMALAAIVKQYKRSGSYTLGILLSTFMLSMLMGMTDKIDFMKYVTPFQYFLVEDMLNSHIEYTFVFISIGIVIICITSMFLTFRKRDLYI